MIESVSGQNSTHYVFDLSTLQDNKAITTFC